MQYTASGGHGGNDGPTPPTYFRENEFTAPFQQMVFTYGIPRYQEMTPVFFSIVSFPFLFGVMFGDIGHGLMLVGIALAIIAYEEQLKYRYPEVWGFRYMVGLQDLNQVQEKGGRNRIGDGGGGKNEVSSSPVLSGRMGTEGEV